jgi:hypothetical protein
VDGAGLLFALVSALCGASSADHQTSSVAPTGPTSAAGTLLAAIAPALARDAGERYAPHPVSDGTPGLVASNPAQHLIARFLSDAVRLHGDTTNPDDGASWGMRLVGTGYGADVRAVPSALRTIDGVRIMYVRGDATEWYLNSPLGIEQGFTLAAPPATSRTGNLTLAVALDFVAAPVGASGTFGGSATVDVTTDGNATAPAFTANATKGSYVVSVAVGGVTTPVFNLTNLPTSATRMAIATVNGQSATIGAALVDPLSVLILDASGNGISGVPVTFTAPASGAGGTFVGGGATATVTTNSNGFANAPILTTNTVAGAYTVAATATGITAPARFSLVNLPGAATHFALAFPPNVQAGKSAPLTLTALDAGGNAATGYSGAVHFTSTDPAASLPANYTFLPGDTGIHAFRVTFSAVGSRMVTATDTSSAITGSQSVNVTPSITTVTPVNGPQTGGGH